MKKTVSFGVLIVNDKGQLLMAHATGRRYWDIPKGGADEGESARAAAIREVREETGIVLAADAMEDLGRMPYLPRKDLHLFRARVSARDCDISTCTCTSYFKDPVSGVIIPEVDRFRWVDFADIPALAAKSMTAALRGLPGFEGMKKP